MTVARMACLCVEQRGSSSFNLQDGEASSLMQPVGKQRRRGQAPQTRAGVVN